MKAVTVQGGIYEDARGVLRYVNDTTPGTYRRFYLISHPDTAIVRAWQGHKIEEKAFYATGGSFCIAVVQPQHFEAPSEDEQPEFFTLSADNYLFLRVPGGSYTGIKALAPHSTLLVLSSLDLPASKADDYRQEADKWVDWNNLKSKGHD